MAGYALAKSSSTLTAKELTKSVPSSIKYLLSVNIFVIFAKAFFLALILFSSFEFNATILFVELTLLFFFSTLTTLISLLSLILLFFLFNRFSL